VLFLSINIANFIKQMDLIEILEFAIRAALSSPLNLVFAIVGSIVGYFLVVGIKNLINTKWPGGKVCAVIAAAFGAICTFAYLGLAGSESYVQLRKAQIKSELDSDIVWRNEALSRTWEIIATEENQKGVTPIIEGGTMINLASFADAQIYAQEAAQVLENKLNESDKSYGSVNYQSKEDVAITVMAANQNTELREASESTPYELYEDNGIASQVLDLRIDERFLAESEGVAAEKHEAMSTATWLGACVIALMSIIAGYGGWRDLLSTK
jgi:hypothetical protein